MESKRQSREWEWSRTWSHSTLEGQLEPALRNITTDIPLGWGNTLLASAMEKRVLTEPKWWNEWKPTCMWIDMCIHAYICVCTHICTCKYTYEHLYTYTHQLMHIDTQAPLQIHTGFKGLNISAYELPITCGCQQLRALQTLQSDRTFWQGSFRIRSRRPLQRIAIEYTQSKWRHCQQKLLYAHSLLLSS